MARENTNKDTRTTNSALGCETKIHFPRRPSNSSLRHSLFGPHVALESEAAFAEVLVTLRDTLLPKLLSRELPVNGPGTNLVTTS